MKSRNKKRNKKKQDGRHKEKGKKVNAAHFWGSVTKEKKRGK